MWVKGQSGNPKGRPRKGCALTDAIRELVDPRAQVKRILAIAMTSPSDTTRLAAETWLADRGYTRPAIRHEVGGPGHFELMDSEELDGVIEANMAALREIASLVRAGEIYLPEDGVIDIPTRPQLEEPKEPRILSFLELEAIEQEEEEHSRLERAKKGAPDPFEED